MRLYLILISVFLLLFFFNAEGQTKKDINRWGGTTGKNYIYQPSLGEVLIAADVVTVRGDNVYQKTTIADTNGTRFIPQRWVVIENTDSLPGLSATFYDLEEDSTYTYYHSLFQLNIDSSVVYKKSNDSTFTTPVGFNTYGTYTADGYRLYFIDGSRIILTQEE